MMMRTMLMMLALAGLIACGKSAEPVPTTPAATVSAPPAAPAPAAPVVPAAPIAPAAAPAAGIVTVAAEGTRFEPAVRVDQVPAGAWYCEMGTVHYARMTEGDATCGICGMKLKHKAP